MFRSVIYKARVVYTKTIIHLGVSEARVRFVNGRCHFNGPFPSYPLLCIKTSLGAKYENKFHLYVHFHANQTFARRLVLKQRQMVDENIERKFRMRLSVIHLLEFNRSGWNRVYELQLAKGMEQVDKGKW